MDGPFLDPARNIQLRSHQTFGLALKNASFQYISRTPKAKRSSCWLTGEVGPLKVERKS